MARRGLFTFFIHPSYAIRRRIFWGLGSICLVFILVVAGFVWRISQLSERERYLLQIAYPSQQQLEALKGHLIQTNSALQNQLIYKSPLFAADRENIWNVFIRATTDSLNIYEKKWQLIEDRTEYATLLTEVEKLRRYQRSVAGVLETEGSTESFSNTQIALDTQSIGKIVVDEEQTDAVFDPNTAFPNTDLEAGIEGLESVQSKDKSAREVIDDKKLDAERFVVLSNNTKQLYQKQIIELTAKIYNDIDRLIRNRKEQIRIEKANLTLQWQILQIIGVIFALISIVLVYVLSRNIGAAFMERMRLLNSHLQNIVEGNIPKKLEDKEKDEVSVGIKQIEKISQELEQLTQLASSIGEGRFDLQIPIFKNEGEVGTMLAKMQSGLLSVAEQDETRNWQNEGLALFAEILRDIDNPQRLYDAITKNIVKYLRGNYGGVYIANTGEEVVPHLELKSAYAYDKKKFIQQQIYLGQGLVGQCWQEGETIFLLKIPKDYIHIASGLGEENPRSILIVPIKVANEVYGVIEVASLKVFTESQRAFLETIAEDIASTISSIKSNEKTRLLLAESRSITEQMTAQEMEMKQSMARLVEAREELEKRNADMAALVAAIDKATIVVELDRQGYFTRVNERFLEASGYQMNDVIGQHRSFYAPKDSDPAEFNLLWAQLAQGTYVEKNIRRIRKNGSEFWMRASFFPVMDAQGTLVKVTSICTDITDKMLKENKDLEAQKTIGFKNAALEHSFLVFETNEQFKIKNINAFAIKDLEIHKEDYIGHHIDEIVLGRLDYKALFAELESREIAEGIAVLRAANFGYRYVKFVVASVRDKKGEIETIFFIGSDITDYKTKEIQLENEVKSLERKVEKLEAKLAV
jgi:PAS domain S-box-containing protein